MRSKARLLAAALVLCACLPGVAHATQSATITATFSPLKLGAATTMKLGLKIDGVGGGIPSPLTGIDLRYPANLGIATSGLGIASCDQVRLEAVGPPACPQNSRMGGGSALVRFQIGPEIFSESARIVLVAGTPEHGYVRLLVAATGVSPVAARIVMSTLLVPGHLQIAVPLVASLPEGAPVAVVGVTVVLGGNLSYSERRAGKLVSYRPKGIGLPRRCPPGGFQFGGTFSFADGTQAVAQTRVPCPGHGRG